MSALQLRGIMSASEGNNSEKESNLVMAFPQWRHWEQGELGPNQDYYEDEDDDEGPYDQGPENEVVYGSLEEYMNRNKKAVQAKTNDDIFIENIEKQTKSIARAHEKIKFYLEEIEMFLPRRK